MVYQLLLGFPDPEHVKVSEWFAEFVSVHEAPGASGSGGAKRARTEGAAADEARQTRLQQLAARFSQAIADLQHMGIWRLKSGGRSGGRGGASSSGGTSGHAQRTFFPVLEQLMPAL